MLTEFHFLELFSYTHQCLKCWAPNWQKKVLSSAVQHQLWSLLHKVKNMFVKWGITESSSLISCGVKSCSVWDDVAPASFKHMSLAIYCWWLTYLFHIWGQHPFDYIKTLCKHWIARFIWHSMFMFRVCALLRQRLSFLSNWNLHEEKQRNPSMMILCCSKNLWTIQGMWLLLWNYRGFLYHLFN